MLTKKQKTKNINIGFILLQNIGLWEQCYDVSGSRITRPGQLTSSISVEINFYLSLVKFCFLLKQACFK